MWVPATQLRAMTAQKRLQVLYHCDLTSLFDSKADAEKGRKTWLQQTLHLRDVPEPVPDQVNMAVHYLRDKMESQGFFSMPVAAFRLALDQVPNDTSALGDIVSRTLGAIGSAPVPFNFVGVETVFFQVLDPFLENKHSVKIHMAPKQRHRMSATVCSVLKRKPDTMEVICFYDGGPLAILHLDRWFDDFGSLLPCIYRWYPGTMMDVSKPRTNATGFQQICDSYVYPSSSSIDLATPQMQLAVYEGPDAGLDASNVFGHSVKLCSYLHKHGMLASKSRAGLQLACIPPYIPLAEVDVLSQRGVLV